MPNLLTHQQPCFTYIRPVGLIYELHFPHFPCDVNNKKVIKICNLCAYLISYPLFYMSMYNLSRIIDAKIVKLSLCYMLMGGLEIYPRCAKCVVPEGVRHRVRHIKNLYLVYMCIGNKIYGSAMAVWLR